MAQDGQVRRRLTRSRGSPVENARFNHGAKAATPATGVPGAGVVGVRPVTYRRTLQ